MVEMVETANILNHAPAAACSFWMRSERRRAPTTGWRSPGLWWSTFTITRTRAKTLFATHYHELTDLAERLPHVVNTMWQSTTAAMGGCGLSAAHHSGRADRSYGVHVAHGRAAGSGGQPRRRNPFDLERSGGGPKRLHEAETARSKAAAGVALCRLASGSRGAARLTSMR